MITIKQCLKCGQTKPVSDFTICRKNKDGLQSWCKKCKNEEVKQYRINHLEERKKYDKDHYFNNREEIRKHKKDRFQKRRLFALQIVSGLEIPKCIICGCDFIPLLEINHKNNDGKEDRKVTGKSETFYIKIIKGGRIIDDLDVRCKLHNDLYYYNTKFGVSLPYKIIWGN